ncbi:hypothetical protein GCM10010495_09790 [Kitasatospora herbaricolor]|nr:hypothetical protein GCM10010495_09790 [Kitasatospora herbaricolor]
MSCTPPVSRTVAARAAALPRRESDGTFFVNAEIPDARMTCSPREMAMTVWWVKVTGPLLLSGSAPPAAPVSLSVPFSPEDVHPRRGLQVGPEVFSEPSSEPVAACSAPLRPVRATGRGPVRWAAGARRGGLVSQSLGCLV